MTEAEWWAATEPVHLLAWFAHSGPDFSEDKFEELTRHGLFRHVNPSDVCGPAHYAPTAASSGAERNRQVRLLHDVFGPLPFRDVAIDPAWLTSDVLALARGVYDDKAFDRLPVLADALQDAGCDHDEVSDHCRAANWEHVRGCWVLDLLLGRPWRE